MSAGILRALVQLFAIIAGGNRSTGREIVAVFLRQQLNKEMVNHYLSMFDEYAEKHHSSNKPGRESSEKRTSLNSVKVLRICDRINEELAQKEKLFVLLRLLEFVHAFTEQHQQESEFVNMVAEAFNIEPSDIENLQQFIHSDEQHLPANPAFLVVSGTEQAPDGVNVIQCEGLRGKLICLRMENENLFFIRHIGKEELLLNGQSIVEKRAYVLSPGSSIRGPRTNTLFYSDILHKFIQTYGDIKIVYRAENISYLWPHNKKQAIHQLNIIEESGSIVGIMGGSGAGKSTLLNIMNGNTSPTYGKVTINGYDIHKESEKIEGVLGYVSQDDLLVEELTVFQNLYFNAQLCFANKTNEEIAALVHKTLKDIGLFEAKDLKVGSVLEKTISGGQRKRLNIALELIREPSVLFVDEPTSGLSSRDSENIMDLLKELTLKGKLVFVVIHQPSSEIFKMFDKLFIMDHGGFPIYYGNPIESIIHFKKLVNHVNHNESECPHCGNVNPEQIFNIIEAKVVDEYGNLTEHRKITPREWNNFFNVIIGNHITVKDKILDTPKSAFSLPSRFTQFLVYAWRDVRTKLANQQYMLINFLEAPVLAFVLSLFIKYYPTDTDGRQDYSFAENLNFPQYLFISVMVALFLGLTVSAEEIIRDQKMLRRERYLHLSRKSYLFAKTSIVFLMY
jgi:ABC transport system ATP-binding/permease protein